MFVTMFISIKIGSKSVLLLFNSAFHKLTQNMQRKVSSVVSKGYREILTSDSHGEGGRMFSCGILMYSSTHHTTSVYTANEYFSTPVLKHFINNFKRYATSVIP